MKARIYYNFNKGLWSVQSKDKSYYPGKVVAHATRVLMEDCRTVVSLASQARCRREQRKNVHAYIDGTLKFMNVDLWRYPLHDNYMELSNWHLLNPVLQGCLDEVDNGDYIRYNPYRDNHFKWDQGSSTEGHDLKFVEFKERWVKGVRHANV